MKNPFRTILLVCLSAAWTVAASAASALQDGNTVTGTVTDETGAPLVGLTVVISGTNTGAVTDLDGH